MRLWHKCLLTGIQAWISEVHRLLSPKITRALWVHCALIKMEFCIWILAQCAPGYHYIPMHQRTRKEPTSLGQSNHVTWQDHLRPLLEQRAPPKHSNETQIFNIKRGIMLTTRRGKGSEYVLQMFSILTSSMDLGRHTSFQTTKSVGCPISNHTETVSKCVFYDCRNWPLACMAFADISRRSSFLC